MRELPPPLSPDVALFLDFDGTLTEIAATPDSVTFASGLAELLRATAWGLNGALAIISGRPIAAIDGYLDASIPAVAGVSGAERRSVSGQVHRTIGEGPVLDSARAALRDFVREHPGALLEDKVLSLAVHYRLAPQLGPAVHAAVARCAAASHGVLEKIDSAMLAELRPVGVRKADAVLAYMNEPPFAGRRPVFVGDDPVDEDAFTEINRSNGFSVIVGNRRDTAAMHRLADVSAVHDWLRDFAKQTAMGDPVVPRAEAARDVAQG